MSLDLVLILARRRQFRFALNCVLMVAPCRKSVEISHFAALQWKIVYLHVNLVTLNLHIPHGSVCYWHSACRVLLSPVTFKLGLWPEMCILRRHLLTGGSLCWAAEDETKLSALLYESFSGSQTSQVNIELCCDMVAWCQTKRSWNPERSWSLPSPPPPPHWGWIWETYVGELSWLRTSVACLELSGRVSVYASVVNWFLSCRQSPTVGRVAAPLLPVVGRCDCRHSVVYTALAASRHRCTCWKVTW